jgi:hypothetical protein
VVVPSRNSISISIHRLFPRMEVVATIMAQFKVVVPSRNSISISIHPLFPRMEVVATIMAQFKVVVPSRNSISISIHRLFPTNGSRGYYNGLIQGDSSFSKLDLGSRPFQNTKKPIPIKGIGFLINVIFLF